MRRVQGTAEATDGGGEGGAVEVEDGWSVGRPVREEPVVQLVGQWPLIDDRGRTGEGGRAVGWAEGLRGGRLEGGGKCGVPCGGRWV